MVVTSEDLHRIAEKAEEEGESQFRKRLQAASDAFAAAFEEWADQQALAIAKRGRKQAHQKYPVSFHERKDGFRLSTFVKGFRDSSGAFNPSRFLDIGYTSEVPTPFEKARISLRERGINVEDVSDPSKGLGFWLKIYF